MMGWLASYPRSGNKLLRAINNLRAQILIYSRGRPGHHALNRLLRRPWRGGIKHDPYDRAAREQLAENLFNQYDSTQPLGTVERSRVILGVIEQSAPTEQLTAAYFGNLELLFNLTEARRTPGQIVFGLGSGRSGSTSLMEILGAAEGSRCTHENPPFVAWQPQAEELAFHVRRFRFLARYFSLIADVSHWWLNALDDLFTQLPDAKAVGSFRNVETCAASHMEVSGFGRGSYNPWAPYGNGFWVHSVWDPTNPTYPLPDNFKRDPDGVKLEMIRRYVREYNETLHAHAARRPQKILLVRTEDLSKPAVQKSILDFVGVAGRLVDAQMNVSTVVDGRKLDYRF
jgi:hypothetical protein